jgi:hypothetical protein
MRRVLVCSILASLILGSCRTDNNGPSASTLPTAPRLACLDYYTQTSASDCWLTALGPSMHGSIWDDISRLLQYSQGSLCYYLGAEMNDMMPHWYQTDMTWPIRDGNGNQEYDQFGYPKYAGGEYSPGPDEIHQARNGRSADGTPIPMSTETIQFIARHEAAHRMFGTTDESTANGVARSCAPGTETGGPGDPY